MDRSLAFTALLNLGGEQFGRLSLRESGEVITAFLSDYSVVSVKPHAPTMYEYAKVWLNQCNGLVCPECGSWLGKQHAAGCGIQRKSFIEPVLLEACKGV